MAKSSPLQNQIINCHTHIFIGENIPPEIGKTFLPWPLYKIFTIPLILSVCRFYYTNRRFSPYCWQFQEWFKRLKKWFYLWRINLKRNFILNTLTLIINVVVIYFAAIYLMEWLADFWIKSSSSIKDALPVIEWLKKHYLFIDIPSCLVHWLFILFTIFFISTGRKILFFILKKAWNFLSILPNKKTIEFIGRYVNIGRFAYYKNSYQIFQKLQGQYPDSTGFVLLPMDMEFMGGGALKADGQYEKQMNDLDKIKTSNPGVVFPFVAVDPRRKTVGTANQKFFDWSSNGAGGVKLEECFIKDFIEKKGFSGFKIYPALGYYPFDEALLPLWKYAADNGIPIITHCIRGTIFFRGAKEKAWDHHPIFKESSTKDVWDQLLLPELRNVDFINNFTHPLNYLCLVEEKLLRLVVGKCSQKTKDLFGYQNENTAMASDLKKLKLCFGHYGGDDEWAKYFEKDRDNITNQLVRQPGKGVVFIQLGPIDSSYGTLELIWRNLDWYTIISSMMLQYPNLYADLSYIVHNENIIPLLKTTLKNPVLQTRILFGTDFYVVRNHKSDKEMFAEIEGNLTTAEFDLIAKTNPGKFLQLNVVVN